MRHAREDYNRFQDPAGIIPEDEPVFLIRGQDELAPRILRTYAWEALQVGLHDIATRVLAWAERMERWQRNERRKLPDLPAEYRAGPETPPALKAVTILRRESLPKALTLILSREVTDQEMRDIHDVVRGWLDAAEGPPLTIEDAPHGTYAPRINGGGWQRQEGGWRYIGANGADLGLHDRLGPDWDGTLQLPDKDWTPGPTTDPAPEPEPVLTLANAPIGARAPANVGGGAWIKEENGWRYRNGASRGHLIPAPGHGWDGTLIVAVPR